MSISEDPQYPWALHRMALLHEREGNYQMALDSAYETQDARLYPQDEEAHAQFDKTIERLEDLIEKHGPRNEDMQQKLDDPTQQFFDDAFARIHKLVSQFPTE